jgi:hypothetical protein
MSDPDLSGVTRAGFLDELERFAKLEERIAIVRLVFENESPVRVVDLTYDEYKTLTPAGRRIILDAGSIAGYVVTEGKSNA